MAFRSGFHDSVKTGLHLRVAEGQEARGSISSKPVQGGSMAKAFERPEDTR